MPKDPRVAELARLIVGYSLQVKPGELVLIDSLEELRQRLRDLGMVS